MPFPASANLPCSPDYAEYLANYLESEYGAVKWLDAMDLHVNGLS